MLMGLVASHDTHTDEVVPYPWLKVLDANPQRTQRTEMWAGEVVQPLRGCNRQVPNPKLQERPTSLCGRSGT